MGYEFSNFRLDADRLELHGPAGRISAEPLVLEFLAYLVRHRDRVVGKEELTTEVWHAKVVSDAALVRCASEARRLLGDRERPHRFLETVYGRGYRFAAPVTETTSPASAPGTEERPAVETDVDTAETGAGGSARLRLAAIALGIVLPLAALSIVVLRWSPSPPSDPTSAATEPEGPLAADGTLAIAWSAPSGEPELRLVALSLSDLLAHALAIGPGPVLTAPPEHVADLRQPSVARAVERLGADRIVHLDVLPSETPGFARVDARLIDARTAGAPTFSLGRYALPTLTEDPDDLRTHVTTRDSLLDQLATSLRSTFGQLGGASGSIPRHPVAWRLYLDARSSWAVSCSDRRAIASLERSLELDPDFAPAWGLLAGARLSEVNLCGTVDADYGPVLEAADRAIELAADWPSPYQLRASVNLYTGDVETAYADLLTALRRFPSSFFVRMRSAEALRYAGFLDRSTQEFEQALDLWPAAMKLTDSIPYPYLYRGEWDRFLEELSGMDSPYFLYYRGWAELWRGERPRAIDSLEAAAREQPDDLFGQLSRALLATLQERDDDAVAVLEALASRRRDGGPTDGEVTYKIAQILALADREEESLEQLELAVDQGFFCARCIELDPAFESVREAGELERILSRARDRHVAFARRFDLEPEQVSGGDPVEGHGSAAAELAALRAR